MASEQLEPEREEPASGWEQQRMTLKPDDAPTVEEKLRQSTPNIEPFHILDTLVNPGSKKTLRWLQRIGGFEFRSPVVVIHGTRSGPVACITAAIHGDELNGIEIARRIGMEVEPEALRGTLISVPLINMEGFFKQSRYVADRRDLNRYFPGSPEGSAPARLAYSLYTQIIEKCDALMDLHTGSYYRSNLPQLRADMTNEQVAHLAESFGGMTVLHSPGVDGMLRVVAVEAGIPAVTMEVGGPLSLDVEDVEVGKSAILNAMAALGMLAPTGAESIDQPSFFKSVWVRANAAGIFISDVKLGDPAQQGTVLGHIIDPVSNETSVITAPAPGTVLGLADNQFVSSGYALCRIGFEEKEESLQRDAKERKRKEAEKQIAEGMKSLKESGEVSGSSVP